MTITGVFTRPTGPVLSALVLDAADVLDDLLTGMAVSIDPVTHQWNGVAPLPDYWFAAASPAAAGAMYDRVISGNKWRSQAIATIDGALNLYTQANGSWGTAGGAHDNSIDTMEFGKALAVTLLCYGDQIGAARRARWSEALLDGAEYLRAHNNLNFFTNGNIEIGEYVFLRLTYKATGDYTVGQLAEKAWWTAHDPVASNNDAGWAGYGFILPGTATADTNPHDGRATSGYFTEEGAGGNGLDYNYTLYTTSILALGYLFDPEPRVGRLVNLLLNTLWSRVNTSTWEINVGGGTRQFVGVPTALSFFDTPALWVAVNELGRVDLDDPESQYYDGTGVGGIKRTWTVDAPGSTANGYYRASFGTLGAFVMLAAGLAGA